MEDGKPPNKGQTLSGAIWNLKKESNQHQTPLGLAVITTTSNISEIINSIILS
jgi:hypothetical protein